MQDKHFLCFNNIIIWGHDFVPKKYVYVSHLQMAWDDVPF